MSITALMQVYVGIKLSLKRLGMIINTDFRASLPPGRHSWCRGETRGIGDVLAHSIIMLTTHVYMAKILSHVSELFF